MQKIRRGNEFQLLRNPLIRLSTAFLVFDKALNSITTTSVNALHLENHSKVACRHHRTSSVIQYWTQIAQRCHIVLCRKDGIYIF